MMIMFNLLQDEVEDIKENSKQQDRESDTNSKRQWPKASSSEVPSQSQNDMPMVQLIQRLHEGSVTHSYLLTCFKYYTLA